MCSSCSRSIFIFLLKIFHDFSIMVNQTDITVAFNPKSSCLDYPLNIGKP